MYKSERILKAIGNIDDEIIEHVGSRQGVLKPANFHQRGIRKAGSLILIAAIITTLFTVTAYATGWFGLSTRVTKAELPYGIEAQSEVSGYISMNGYSETVEGKAHAEWQQIWQEHYQNNPPQSDEVPGDSTAEIYLAYDQPLMDELLRIRDQYGLRLHTRCIPVAQEGLDYFYKISGIPSSILDENSSSSLQMHYVYEDGSFKGEGRITIDGADCKYTLIRAAKGVLDPSSQFIISPDNYTEWQFTDSSGNELSLSLENSVNGRGQRNYFIFYDGGNYLVNIFGDVLEQENLQSCIEKLGESFDYDAICGGVLQLDSETKVAVPSEAERKQELLTWEAFSQTDEYRASTVFKAAYCAYAENLPENANRPRGETWYAYYGSLPAEKEEINEILEKATSAYSLKLPGKSQAIMYDEWVRPEDMVAPGTLILSGAESTPASEQDYYTLIGMEHFLPDGEGLNVAVAWENGAFFCQAYSFQVHYIPRGCFYPLLQGMTKPDGPSWAYNTAQGVQVLIACNNEQNSSNQDYILYETDCAYVVITLVGDTAEKEAIADRIDFTKFR